MHIDRLFQIVQILLHKEKVTAGELAQRFEVSTRTIYRDVDTLSISGVPIYTTKGKGGGIRLLENYKMDRSVLSDEEKNHILLGLETLKATEAEDVGQVLEKFRDVFQHDHSNWIRIDFSHWGNDPKERQKFENIKKALITYHVIEFYYYDANGNHTMRRVCPIQLLFKEKAWYLIAYCLQRNAFRFFKLIRMAEVTMIPETFMPSDYPLEEDLLLESVPMVGVPYKFWLSSEVRYRLYDDFYKDQIKVLPDGNYEVTYYGKEDEWLYSFILGYGEYLKVLEPESLRDRVYTKISKMKENYS